MISIALATYNGERFLREQLDSIYSQTYQDIEVVACDDCSSDQTVSILKEYEHTRGLRYYANPRNLGYIKNFEKAISLCEGEYIALSDQDDIWMPNKLVILMEAIADNLLAFSDMRLIDDQGATICESFFDEYAVNPERAKSFKYMAFRNYVTGCSILFRSELFSEARPFDARVPHDYWLALLALKRDKITYCDQSLVQYRQHSMNQIGIRKTGFFERLYAVLILNDTTRANVLDAVLESGCFNDLERQEFLRAKNYYLKDGPIPIAYMWQFIMNIDRIGKKSVLSYLKASLLPNRN